MKKKLVSALLCATMMAGCLTFAGCGGSDDGNAKSDNATDEGDTAADGADAADDTDGADGADAEGGDSETAAAETFNSTFGDANGTHLDLWTFVDAHAEMYGKMVEKWNTANPDRTIELTAVSYPFSDMQS